MTLNTKFYKIKILKEFLASTQTEKKILFEELIDHAIDPVIFKRRLRMIQHLNSYENQIIQKIQDFETDNVQDFEKVLFNVRAVVNRNA